MSAFTIDQLGHLSPDAQRAYTYWAGHTRRIYAIDLEAGPRKKPSEPTQQRCVSLELAWLT